jgi:4-hydroxybenzoyl-CoA thioesterase
MFANRRDVMIEWGDCDPAGIVFYPRYFAMFDASTAALFAAALGFNKSEMLTRFGIVGIPMVDTGAKFLVPSKFGDVITIESRVTAFRRRSFDVAHLVYRGETLAIEAHETRVWAARDPENAARIKGVTIPPEVQAAFVNTSALT